MLFWKIYPSDRQATFKYLVSDEWKLYSSLVKGNRPYFKQ